MPCRNWGWHVDSPRILLVLVAWSSAGAGHSAVSAGFTNRSRSRLAHDYSSHLNALHLLPWLPAGCSAMAGKGTRLAEPAARSAPTLVDGCARYGKALERSFRRRPPVCSDYSAAVAWRVGPWPAAPGFNPQKTDSRWGVVGVPVGCLTARTERVVGEGRQCGRRSMRAGRQLLRRARSSATAPPRGIFFLRLQTRFGARGNAKENKQRSPSPNGWGRHARTDPRGPPVLRVSLPRAGIQRRGGWSSNCSTSARPALSATV